MREMAHGMSRLGGREERGDRENIRTIAERPDGDPIFDTQLRVSAALFLRLFTSTAPLCIDTVFFYHLDLDTYPYLLGLTCFEREDESGCA
jgi:hypothetical protein